MSKLLSFEGSMTSGHDCYPPTPITKGSSDVYVEGKPAANKGSIVEMHASPSPSPPHPRSISSGSGSVNINGTPASRIGDDIDCGGKILQGNSATVFVGD